MFKTSLNSQGEAWESCSLWATTWPEYVNTPNIPRRPKTIESQRCSNGSNAESSLAKRTSSTKGPHETTPALNR